ncbi:MULTISPECIES: hypothetical protein [Stutzerimonas stutzeri subgroup]|uniref:Uncharacterized protein n=1 Tax=Stutzerimonas stutzeri RCH2 TaxID=644801 RepID=L0GN26_STUST|nr:MULTISPECIES: hypothetical protein [Stutzerimonas stutzeri subgroup]AGA86724.1 hypothetical protein Psest_2190 [Stutzerimonas stutzeri RCH2]AGA86733.1 hypothetical protein Psest_2199 [Stutzerimonas stutzeri RCH2]UIP30893.1 hypothetical protein LW136_12000 [Stutzerimonas kunmingensis]
MGQLTMPATLRLSNTEQEALRQKCIEINKLLVRQGRMPIKDSELAHFILEKATPCAKVSASGDLTLELEV